jgi:hypothetical protein
MIVEIVSFDLPPGTTRADALALYRKTAATWLTNKDLLEKYYVFDAENLRGGGIYIWPTREAARHWHGEDYRRMVMSLYGAPPKIQLLDAVIRVDPAVKRIEDV